MSYVTVRLLQKARFYSVEQDVGAYRSNFAHASQTVSPARSRQALAKDRSGKFLAVVNAKAATRMLSPFTSPPSKKFRQGSRQLQNPIFGAKPPIISVLASRPPDCP